MSGGLCALIGFNPKTTEAGATSSGQSPAKIGGGQCGGHDIDVAKVIGASNIPVRVGDVSADGVGIWVSSLTITIFARIGRSRRAGQIC